MHDTTVSKDGRVTNDFTQSPECWRSGLYDVGEMFLVAAKPTTLVEANVLSSFFFLSKFKRKGKNSTNKHGSICSLGHKFHI